MKKTIIITVSFLSIIFITLTTINYRLGKYMTDDINKVLLDKKYERPIELTNFPIHSQLHSYSCGPATLSMAYSFIIKSTTEKQLTETLNLENRKRGMLPNTFLKYLRLSLKDYDVSLKSNISNSEVLKLIYAQLEDGIPVPVYFSTINAWDKPNYDTHYSAVIGIDMTKEKIIIANAYGFSEEVSIIDFLDSLKFKNYMNKPLYLKASVFFGIIKRNNVYLIKHKAI